MPASPLGARPCLLLSLLSALPAAAGPAIKTAPSARVELPRDAALSFEVAERRLRRALAQLEVPGVAASARSAARRQAAQAAAEIQRLLDAAHHDPRLAEPARRPAALALRPQLVRARSAPEGLLTVYGDVWQLRPEVQDRLADAAARDGDRPAELAARLAALVAGPPTLPRLERLAEVLRASGQPEAAAAVEARLRAAVGSPLPH